MRRRDPFLVALFLLLFLVLVFLVLALPPPPFSPPNLSSSSASSSSFGETIRRKNFVIDAAEDSEFYRGDSNLEQDFLLPTPTADPK
jgi:hypothetical protein